jgi:hypothetical protein
MTIKSLKDLRGLDAEAEARAIEADAGHKVPGIRQALREVKTGKGTLHTPESLAAHVRKHQGDYEKRQIESGAQRIPGGLLSPEAARALDKLLANGASSKAAAINQALIAAARG